MTSGRAPVITRPLLFAFALPALMQGFLHAPASTMLQGIYAKHAGLSLAALGVAVLVTRIFDAVTDPLIGILSDLSFRKTGTRKPWVAAGSLITVLGMWFLYNPPADVSIAYFTGWFLCAYLGWTVTEIPYRAWSMEITHDYAQRTRVQTWLAVAGIAGTIGFFTLPPIGKALGLTESVGGLDLGTLAMAAIVIVVLLPVVNLIALLRVPNGAGLSRGLEKESVGGIVRSIVGNRPLLIFILIFAITNIVGGIGQGVTYLFIDSYIGMSDHLATIIIATLPISILATPFWGWLCNRIEKHRAWAIGVAVNAMGQLSFALIPVGETSLLPFMAVTSLVFFGQAVNGVVPQAILGDIIDYGALRFGQDRAGIYYSSFTIISKSVSGIGVALGLFILAYCGFDATASEHDARASFGMLLTMAYLPAVGFLLTTPLMWRFSLNRARHREVLAELQAES